MAQPVLITTDRWIAIAYGYGMREWLKRHGFKFNKSFKMWIKPIDALTPEEFRELIGMLMRGRECVMTTAIIYYTVLGGKPVCTSPKELMDYYSLAREYVATVKKWRKEENREVKKKLAKRMNKVRDQLDAMLQKWVRRH